MIAIRDIRNFALGTAVGAWILVGILNWLDPVLFDRQIMHVMAYGVIGIYGVVWAVVASWAKG